MTFLPAAAQLPSHTVQRRTIGSGGGFPEAASYYVTPTHANTHITMLYACFFSCPARMEEASGEIYLSERSLASCSRPGAAAGDAPCSPAPLTHAPTFDLSFAASQRSKP